jgi:hypothetical protein
VKVVLTWKACRREAGEKPFLWQLLGHKGKVVGAVVDFTEWPHEGLGGYSGRWTVTVEHELTSSAVARAKVEVLAEESAAALGIEVAFEGWQEE